MVKRYPSKTVLACLWFTAVAVGSFLPDNWKSAFGTHGSLHLPIHFAVFAISGVVGLAFASSWKQRLILSAALVSLGFFIEGLQRAIYPIHFEWKDFAADTCGVLAALLVHVAVKNA